MAKIQTVMLGPTQLLWCKGKLSDTSKFTTNELKKRLTRKQFPRLNVKPKTQKLEAKDRGMGKDGSKLRVVLAENRR